MKPFIETTRLIIKAPSLDDMENIAKLYGNPDVMRYIGKGARNYETSLSICQKMLAHFHKHGFSSGDVYEKSTGNYVGRAGIVHLELDDSQPDLEIGYVLNPEFWGMGYATELAQATVSWGFKNLPIAKILAVIHPDNQASRHVLQKINMKFLRHEYRHDMASEVYELQRDHHGL